MYMGHLSANSVTCNAADALIDVVAPMRSDGWAAMNAKAVMITRVARVVTEGHKARLQIEEARLVVLHKVLYSLKDTSW